MAQPLTVLPSFPQTPVWAHLHPAAWMFSCECKPHSATALPTFFQLSPEHRTWNPVSTRSSIPAESVSACLLSKGCQASLSLAHLCEAVLFSFSALYRSVPRACLLLLLPVFADFSSKTTSLESPSLPPCYFLSRHPVSSSAVLITICNYRFLCSHWYFLSLHPSVSSARTETRPFYSTAVCSEGWPR